MSKDMLGVAVRKLVTLPGPVLGIVCDLLEKLADPEWVEATKKFLRKKEPWPQVVKMLLRLVDTVSLPAIETFSAKDHFRVGETDGVKIGWVGDNVKQLTEGVVEPGVAEATLRVHKLLKDSTDAPIIAELGGEGVVTVTWGQMWEILKAQGRGQQGILLVDGRANIFYIRGAHLLWAVYCHWYSRSTDWDVNAHPVAGPNEWYAGRQVVSR